MLVRVLSAVVIVQFTFTFYSTFRLDCLDDIRNKTKKQWRVSLSLSRIIDSFSLLSQSLLAVVQSHRVCMMCRRLITCESLRTSFFHHAGDLTSGGALSHIHDGLVAFQPDAKSLWEWNLRNIFPLLLNFQLQLVRCCRAISLTLMNAKSSVRSSYIQYDSIAHERERQARYSQPASAKKGRFNHDV